MISYENYLNQRNYTLKKELSSKENSAVLLLERPDGSDFVLRLYREEVKAYRELTGCTCENLPYVICCEDWEGIFVVEEEYIDGVSVGEMLCGGERFSAQRAIELVKAICGAVAYLHEKKYIHRDIKPEHILITPKNRIVLVDLGASMQIRPEKTSDTQLLGTAGYAAPEQFGFSRSDYRTEFYAIGILLNELLTGVHPSVRLYKDGPLQQVIEKSTRINPEDRYQTVCQLMEDVESCSGVYTKKFQTAAAGARRKKIFITCLIAILIVGSAVFFLRESPDKTPKANGGTDTEQNDGPAKVEGTDYLQIYKDGDRTVYYQSRQGSQAAQLTTEKGEKVDQSFEVSVDRNVGFVEWSSEFDSWNLVANAGMPGETGYLHAKKDGKHYAIKVLVFAEPTAIYTTIPDIDDLGKGYIDAERQEQRFEQGNIKLTYKKGKPLTLYVVAAHYFTLDSLTCDSPLVTIEEYTGAANYPFPIAKLTFKNPDGGDAAFVVKSEYNTFQITVTEE